MHRFIWVRVWTHLARIVLLCKKNDDLISWWLEKPVWHAVIWGLRNFFPGTNSAVCDIMLSLPMPHFLKDYVGASEAEELCFRTIVFMRLDLPWFFLMGWLAKIPTLFSTSKANAPVALNVNPMHIYQVTLLLLCKMGYTISVQWIAFTIYSTFFFLQSICWINYYGFSEHNSKLNKTKCFVVLKCMQKHRKSMII